MLSLVTTVVVSCQPIFGSSFILSLRAKALRQNPGHYTLYQLCHLFSDNCHWNYTHLLALAQGTFEKIHVEFSKTGRFGKPTHIVRIQDTTTKEVSSLPT